MSDPSWVDRVAGVALGGAVGDALGAGYEFQDRPGPDIDMIGGGPFGVAPGEWTDDTAMANAVLRVAATGEWDPEAIGAGFLEWFAGGPKDVGNQTRAVLGAARTPDRLLAAEHFARNPRGSAGNSSLMRTGPVALAHLGDDTAIAEAARTVSDLTHADPLAGDACVLWCIAIDRAVWEARLDGIDDGLALLPVERRAQWEGWLADARTQPPSRFSPNVVTALQTALAAIHHRTGRRHGRRSDARCDPPKRRECDLRARRQVQSWPNVQRSGCRASCWPRGWDSSDDRRGRVELRNARAGDRWLCAGRLVRGSP